MKRTAGIRVATAWLVWLGATEAAQAACTGGTDIKITTTIEHRDTGGSTQFFDQTPVRTFTGIDRVDVSGMTLLVQVGAKTLHAEYSAPSQQRVEVMRYEAKPGTTLIGNAVLLGLPLLFAPKRQLDRLVGCTDEFKLEVAPDHERKQPTGKVEWRPLEDPKHRFQLTVTGLASPVTLDKSLADRGLFTINLTDTILASPEVQGPLTVSCTTCSADPEGLAAFPNLLATRTVNADFSANKEQELAARAKKQEQEAQALAEQKAREARQQAEAKARDAALQAEQKAREAKERDAREQRERVNREAREQAKREQKTQQQRDAMREQLRKL